MKSIRAKLWFGMMVLVGTIIVLLWLFQIIFLEKFYSVLEVKDVTVKAGKVVKEIEGLGSMDEISNSTEFINSIEDFIYEKQLTVEIIDASYGVVYQGTSGENSAIPGVMRKVAATAIQDALGGKEFKEEVTHPKFGYQFMIMGLPISYKDGVRGAMLITMPMAAVEDTTDILKKQLYLITGILVLVSVLISFRLSKRFTDPILRISKQAESYTSGEYAVRTKDMGKDEIGQLAKGMNEMGEALMRNEVLQKEITANVSHELRTPLSLIRGYAETLRDVTGDNPDKREKQLNIIVEESERLSNMVEDILNLSQLQSGVAILEKEAFSIKEMVLKLREHYELQEKPRTFQMKGIIELKDNMLGDKKKIEQVFHNLLDNAFRHTKDEELVEVAAIEKPDCIRIEITDHGEGIAKEDLEHIFERYYRGKPTGEKKSKGTGLGLAIVKSIMELHKMPFGVESEPGTGTKFWFEVEKDNSHSSF